MKKLPEELVKECADRYKQIADMWVAYHISNEDPAVFGREFYHAVGEILQGNPLNQLELYHIDTSTVKPVVFTGLDSFSQKERRPAHPGSNGRK